MTLKHRVMEEALEPRIKRKCGDKTLRMWGGRVGTGWKRVGRRECGQGIETGLADKLRICASGRHCLCPPQILIWDGSGTLEENWTLIQLLWSPGIFTLDIGDDLKIVSLMTHPIFISLCQSCTAYFPRAWDWDSLFAKHFLLCLETLIKTTFWKLSLNLSHGLGSVSWSNMG